MKEKVLLNFAFFISLLGLLLIFLISKNIEANNTKINKLPDERIEIKGNIERIEQENDNYYLVVSQKIKISNDILDNLKDYNKNQKIRIITKIINGTTVAEKLLD